MEKRLCGLSGKYMVALQLFLFACSILKKENEDTLKSEGILK